MAAIATLGPFIVSVAFHLTDGDQVAQAGVDFPPGELPTAERLAEFAERVRAQVQGQLGASFGWQGRHGFISDAMAERAGGMRFAVPGPDKWEAEWAADTVSPDEEEEA